MQQQDIYGIITKNAGGDFMVKCWLNMWKNIFNYLGTVTRREYWLSICMNVIFMYALAVPCGLICRGLNANVNLVIIIYLAVFHLPVLSLYFRRGRGAGWKFITSLYLAVVLPCFSGIMVGFINNAGAVKRGEAIVGKLLALGFGLFFYGSVINAVFYGDPAKVAILPISGLLVASLTLIVYGIIHWREVVAFFIGPRDI